MQVQSCTVMGGPWLRRQEGLSEGTEIRWEGPGNGGSVLGSKNGPERLRECLAHLGSWKKEVCGALAGLWPGSRVLGVVGTL